MSGAATTTSGGAQAPHRRDPPPGGHGADLAPPPVVAPPPGNPRFPLMDSLRAVAALGVLLGHVGAASGFIASHGWGQWLANGDQGVTIFFIVSGFLLYRPFVHAQLNGAPPVALRDYARRRVLRIVPAYWLALTLLAVGPGLAGVFGPDWWRYYFFGQVYFRGSGFGGLIQAWTLCVEVSFYVLLPVYALAIARLFGGLAPRRRLQAELTVLAVLSLASILTRYFARSGPLHGALPGYLYWFALGMGLALVSAAADRSPRPGRLAGVVSRRPALSWAAAAGLYAVLSLTLRAPSSLAGYPRLQEVALHHVLGGAFAFFLVLPAVIGAEAAGWPRRVLAWRPLAWVGLISYGVYLWQGNVSDWLAEHGLGGAVGPFPPFAARALGTVAASLVIAALSYYVLERPILRLKYQRHARRGVVPGAPAAVSHRR